MFCRNCGSPIADDQKVCPVCGKVIENAPAPQEPEQTPEPPKKKSKERSAKKSKRLPIIISATAIVLAAAIIVSVICWDNVSNFFAKTVMPAEDYYTHVEQSNVEQSVKLLYSALNMGSSLQNIEDGFTGSMKIELGESMEEFYKLAGMEGDLTWLENVEFVFDADASAKALDMDLTGKLNDTEILSTNMILDIENNNGYITVPQLFKKYIQVPLTAIYTRGVAAEDSWESGEESAEPSDSEDLSDISDELSAQLDELEAQLEKFLSAIPTEKVTSKLMVKYFDVLVDSLDNVEKESTKLEIEGVSQSCTLLTVELDGEAIVTATTAVLEEAVKDDEIKKIIQNFAEAYEEDGDELYDTFTDAVEELLDEIDSLDTEELDELMGDEIVLKNWVASDGVIIGREIEVAGSSILFASVEQGSKIATKINAKQDGTKLMEFKGSGKKSGSMINATYTLEIEKQEVLEIEVKDYDSEAFEEDGYLNGEFYFGAGDDLDLSEMVSEELAPIMDDLRLGFGIQSGEKEFSFSTMLMNGKKPYITCSVGAKLRGYEKPSAPAKDQCVSVEDENGLTELAGSVSFDQLIENLRNAGVPTEFVDQFEMLINGGLVGSLPNEWDDSYDEDYDWDTDWEYGEDSDWDTDVDSDWDTDWGF